MGHLGSGRRAHLGDGRQWAAEMLGMWHKATTYKLEATTYKLHTISICNTVMRLAVYFLVLTHMIACLWYGLMTDDTINPPPNWFSNQNIERNKLLDNYAMCFYAALAMFSGEDVEPTTSAERVFAIATLFSGTVALAVIVGQITVLLQNFDMGRNRYQEKMKVGR